MTRATYAWLVAGSVFLQGVSHAGEGSSLRGLKPPTDAAEATALALTAGHSDGVDWRSAAAREDLAPRLTLYTGTRETSRGSSGPVSYSTSLHRPAGLAASAFPTAPLDPRFSGTAKYTLVSQLNQALPGDWGVGFGLRQTDYGFAMSNLLALSAERYFGHLRGAYTLYSSGNGGNTLAAAHRIQVNYFYGDRNVVGLAYTTGRDLENIGMSALGLPVADVRDLTLSGRHWLGTNWALTYDVLSQEQSLLSARRQGLAPGREPQLLETESVAAATSRPAGRHVRATPVNGTKRTDSTARRPMVPSLRFSTTRSV